MQENEDYNDYNEEYTDEEIENLVAEFKRMLRKKDVQRMEEEEIEVVIVWAIQHFEVNIAEEALKYALQWYPFEITLHLQKVRLLILKLEIEEAEELLDEIEERFELTSDYYVVRGLICKLMGNDEEVIPALRKAYQMDPELPELTILLAAEYVRVEKYKTALDLLKQMLKMDDDTGSHLYNISCTFNEIEKYSESVVFFQKLTDAFPLSVHCWFGLGLAYNWVKDYPNAIDAFLNAISLEGSTSSVHYHMACAHFEMKNYQEAIENFEEAIAIERDNYSAWSKLGACYEALGDNKKALSIYQQVIDEDSDCEDALLGVLRIYRATGQEKKAERFIHRAFTIEPRSFDLLFALIPYYSEDILNEKLLEFFEITLKHFKYSKIEMFYIFTSYCCNNKDYLALGIEIVSRYQNESEFSLTIPYLLAALYYIKGDNTSANRHFENALLINIDEYGRFLSIHPDLDTIDDVQRLISAYED